MRNRFKPQTTTFLSITIALLSLLFAVSVWAASGTTDSSAAPADTESYTLADIYARLDAGTAGSPSTFTEPAVAPGTGTMNSLNDIMGKAPVVDDTDGAGVVHVLTGKKYWSLTSGAWGLQTGTATAGANVSGADGSKTFSIPDGFYSDKTATANDSNLVAGNIKNGTTILGVTGTFAGGPTCSGTLNGTRWCDNGNGTVTDMTTGLVWLQKADWGGLKAWDVSSGNDDAHTRAGILAAGTAGANLNDGSVEGDWRLPTKTELFALANGTKPVRSSTMRAFTSVQPSYYWSSTSDAGFATLAWGVSLNFGSVAADFKASASYVWPVRGGQ